MKKNMMHLIIQVVRQRVAIAAIALSFALVIFLFFACGKNKDISDLLPPAEVSNLDGVSSNGQVTLKWSDPNDGDFNKIEITYSPGNKTIEVAKGAQILIIKELSNGTAYNFTLKTVDKSGNKSKGITTPYTPLAVDPNDVLAPSEVSNIRAVSGTRQIILSWNDPADNDFTKVKITYTAGGNTAVEVVKGIQTLTVTGLTDGTAYTFTIKTVDAKGNESAGINSVPFTPVAQTMPTVYMTTRITAEGLLAIYNALGRKPKDGQKVAVKISTGEGVNSNHLRPSLIANLVQTVKGDIVECNTAYGGNRASTAMHYQVAADRGYTAIATVVIMDEKGTVDIPVSNGKHLTIDRVGAHFPDYQFHVVLSHFKGHAMAGYGGALKNMSIGYGSTAGKCLIHTGGASSTSPWGGVQNTFLESMAEAAKAIVDKAGSENFIYINVMNRLSVDCDCDGNPAQPTMADVGILASLDPVALDKACLDIVNTAVDGADLRARIARQNGTLTTTHAAGIGLGSLTYKLVKID
jgi:hypothetical protein